MASTIKGILDDKQAIKNQLGGLPDTLVVPKRFVNSVTARNVVGKQERINLDGTTLVWGSTTQGDWGTFNWGASAEASRDLLAVIPNNNIFIEPFGQDMFIDTANSTGTLSTSNETYTLAAGEVLQSEVIAKLQEPITQVKLLSHDDFEDSGNDMILPFTLGVDEFGSDTAQIEFSNDGGSTWEFADENNVLEFSSSATTDELKYRITAHSGFTITEPIFIQVN